MYEIDSNKNYMCIYLPFGKLMCSYNRIIGFRSSIDSKIHLNEAYYCYSKTTIIHRNKMLHVSAKEFNENLKNDVYNIVEDIDSVIDFYAKYYYLKHKINYKL